MTGLDPGIWLGAELGHSDRMLITVREILRASKVITNPDGDDDEEVLTEWPEP